MSYSTAAPSIVRFNAMTLQQQLATGTDRNAEDKVRKDVVELLRGPPAA